MLPPFRIRNLRQSQSSEERHTQHWLQTPLAEPSHHAIVQVSAPEYDEAICRHPEATLKYLDDDDGEVITVRSSMLKPTLPY